MRKSIFFIAFVFCFIHSWCTCTARQTPQDESPALPGPELDEVVVRGKQYKSDTIRQLLNGFFHAKEMVHGYQAYRLMTNDDLVQVFSEFEQSTGVRILPKSYVDFPSIWFTMYKNKAWADYEEAAQGRTRYLTNEIVFQPMTDGTYEIDLRVAPSGSVESENTLTQLVIDAKKEIVQKDYWQNTYFNRPRDAHESVIAGHGELYSSLGYEDEVWVAINQMLSSNRDELSKEILIKVSEGGGFLNGWYFLDPNEQRRADNPLLSTRGGGLYFDIDDNGFINLNEPKHENLKASAPQVVELLLTLEELLVAVVAVQDLASQIDWYGAYEHEGIAYSDILIEEAKSGHLSGKVTIRQIDVLRHQISDRIINNEMSSEELRLAINLLFKINTALKLTFSADEPSLYPFIEFEPDALRLDPLKTNQLVPPNLEKMELGRLRSLYHNDSGSMTAEEIERYFDLLCKVEGDCRISEELTLLIGRWNDLSVGQLNFIFNNLLNTPVESSSSATVTHEEILTEINNIPDRFNPYNFAFDVEDLILSRETLFVRLHNENNPNRPWLVAIEDFKTFNSLDDAINKLALPVLNGDGSLNKPTQISLVKVPKGTKLRRSVARPQDWPG